MLAVALSLSLTLSAAPKSHPYTVKDQVTLRRLASLDVSADGKQVALVVRETDLEANRGRMDIWLVNSDGTGLKQLTTHPENDSDVRFAPDGKSVYFLSARSGTQQVYRLSLEGGEPVAVTQSPLDIGSFILSRDGKQLAFSADVFVGCDGLECTQKKLEEQAKNKATGKLYTELLYRHWDTWKDGRRSHLFVMSLPGGTPKDVMKKMNADAPTKPFGGTEEYTFSPDGKQLVFTARDVGREEAWSTDKDVFSTPVDGSAAPKKLNAPNKGTDTGPVFSPDGKTLAYLSMARAGFEADRQRVMLRNMADGKERELAPNWDRSADAVVWSADSKTIYVSAEELGQRGLFALDVGTGAVKPLVTSGNVSWFGRAGDGLVYAWDSLKGPTDAFFVSADGSGTKQLTQLNADAMAQIRLGDFEQFSFAGANGDKVHGYVVKPVDFDPKKKYPLAFLIHGGPQGSFGNHWHYRWNPQTYAGHGYAAVMIDFHGSTGYGQAFTDAIRNDWGGKPLEDLQKGLAAALAKYPFIDKNKVCALGASYGGYMINWVAGVWNEPFKCLVAHDGNLDEKFAYYGTEELWFPEWEHGGTPWENPEGYEKHNPSQHVSKWKVPMLVIHGGRDYRVVDVEGMATFTALQRRGIPSKFLYFPDENHWVLKPANSVLWHETVLGWLDEWTKK
ncbi:MAG: S9 family peptidase [Myxococcaceae bacterium]|nr:S9 family peptidase [Myxococcaceae bacterium]